MTTADLDRFRTCPIGCGWYQSVTEFDDEPGLRASRSQHLSTTHSRYEIITALDQRAAALAAVERDYQVVEEDCDSMMPVVEAVKAFLITPGADDDADALVAAVERVAAAERDRDRLGVLARDLAEELQEFSVRFCWQGTSAGCDNGGCVHRQALIAEARASAALLAEEPARAQGGVVYQPHGVSPYYH